MKTFNLIKFKMADVRPLLTSICVQFQVGIYHEKIHLDQIQNGRRAATFDFNMRNNWKTVPES